MSASSDPSEALVDLRVVRVMADGCGWTLAEYVAFYDGGAREEYTRIEEAVAGGDAATVERLAHGAKGSSGSAGAAGMVDVWSRLERAAREGDTTAFASLLAEARARLDAVLRALAEAAAREPEA